jgi:hypothetical protein
VASSPLPQWGQGNRPKYSPLVNCTALRCIRWRQAMHSQRRLGHAERRPLDRSVVKRHRESGPPAGVGVNGAS